MNGMMMQMKIIILKVNKKKAEQQVDLLSVR